jgi:hypothetical protein
MKGYNCQLFTSLYVPKKTYSDYVTSGQERVLKILWYAITIPFYLIGRL